MTIEKYDKIALETKNLSRKASIFQSVTHGLFLTFMFGQFLYTYAVGGWLIQNQNINPSTGEVYSIVEIV